MTTAQRLFDASQAFDSQLVAVVVVVILSLLIVIPLLTVAASRLGRIPDKTVQEILVRTRSWAIIVPLVLIPILLGAFWAIGMVVVLSLMGYIEYSRMTGLFRERLVSITVILGILMIGFSVLDHWYGFFVALAPLGVITIATTGVLTDRPEGYVQRVALGSLGFLLFGVCLGHLAYIGNSSNYRPLMILLLFVVSLNDIYAYAAGKLLGKRKLCPNTSPNKTVAGSVGALILTTLTVVIVGGSFFQLPGSMTWYHLIAGGMLLSICGQLGDLMLSAIKRDIGLKDSGTLIPGHGGVLDRIDSLLLTAPATFHFVGFYDGIGLDQSIRIITGG